MQDLKHCYTAPPCMILGGIMGLLGLMGPLTLQANKVDESVPNGPKLEIKTDTKAGVSTLNGTNGVPVTERSLSCNLSPLTPKYVTYTALWSSVPTHLKSRLDDAQCLNIEFNIMRQTVSCRNADMGQFLHCTSRLVRTGFENDMKACLDLRHVVAKRF